MASSAKVTITLGRSGQVVKRRTISDIGIHDELPVSGRKRPVRERLGNTVVDPDSYGSKQGNKRRQTESGSLQIGDDGLVEVHQIGRHDLRLKLMRKGLSKKSNSETEQNGVDLREKLSRNSKNLQGYEARGRVPESRSSYDVREVPESGSGYGSRGRVPESRASTLASQLPSARCADDLIKFDSSGKPYSSWTAGGLRHSSPDNLPSVRRDLTPPRSVRRGMSPPRTYDQARSIPPPGSVGATRSSSHIARDVPDTLRTHQPYEGNSTILLDTVQPANGISSSGARLPMDTVLTEVPLTVTGLLNSLGLEKYVCLFQGEEVDMTALSQMKDGDLKDMGVPMGPRKKILQAAAPYAKQWQRCPMI
ncbi:hypothetical protein QYE76_044409 [Lolium multiflorum]|uniref:SAM domain-containing protein n=1 Tax=Lolium multiflorum TaxID=4521 RepID=A0AAD8TL02_LOLMU|nr:hypothetical protein QYE76_044409 [Lolium multiflorum]